MLRRHRWLDSVLWVALVLGFSIAALAQAPGITAKQLLRTTVSGDASKEAIIFSVEFAPGATTGRHTHPGDEYAAVLEGTLELRVEGQAPHRVSAGQAYHNVRGVLHETRNVGDGPARVISTFVVDKGAAISQPAK